MTMRHWKRIMNEDTHGLFRFFNTKNAQKYQKFYLATQMEHDQSDYFCRGYDDSIFAGALPPGPHPGDGVANHLRPHRSVSTIVFSTMENYNA